MELLIIILATAGLMQMLNQLVAKWRGPESKYAKAAQAPLLSYVLKACLIWLCFAMVGAWLLAYLRSLTYSYMMR